MSDKVDDLDPQFREWAHAQYQAILSKAVDDKVPQLQVFLNLMLMAGVALGHLTGVEYDEALECGYDIFENGFETAAGRPLAFTPFGTNH